MWDARTGTTLLELKGHTNDLLCVTFSPDGSRIVTGGGDGTAKVWDAQAGTTLLELQGAHGCRGERVVQSGWYADRHRRRITNRPGEARVWDARTGTLVLDLKGHTGAVLTASFSPDGTRIVTGSNDNTAKVWDARTGMPLLELKGHTSEVLSATFSPDGLRIVTGGGDRTAKVWSCAHRDAPARNARRHSRCA